MSYTTLLLHLPLGQPNTAVLKVAASLAHRFNAQVVGMAVCQPSAMGYGYGYGDGFIDGNLVAQIQAEQKRERAEAEAQFRTALQGMGSALHWRGAEDLVPLADQVATQARCADLIITPLGQPDMMDSGRTLDTAALVLTAGRPVLVVPPGASDLALGHAVVAWKDGREARRAVADALPLLRRMGQVTVAAVCAADDLDATQAQVDDVAAWLGRHGIRALAQAVINRDSADAAALATLADELGADLVVAGAYGHSRLREWVLGGVTRDLLLRDRGCVLLSH